MKNKLFALMTAVLLLIPQTLPASAAKARIRSVELNISAANISVNHTRNLYAFVTLLHADDILDPDKEIDKGVVWESSNYQIVDVMPDGIDSAIITGISPGTAVITATAEDNKTATCTVTVRASTVSGTLPKDTEKYGELVEKDKDMAGSVFLSADIVSAQVIKPLTRDAVGSVSKGTAGSVVLANKTAVTAEALNSAAYIAAYEGRSVQLKFTTLSDTGIQGQLALDPAGIKSHTKDISTAVYTSGEQVNSLQKLFTTYYTNTTAVIACGQKGSYGMTVRIAAKVNLSALDSGALRFYSYNQESNSVALLDNVAYSVQGEYLYLTTDTGGCIVVTDSPLARK